MGEKFTVNGTHIYAMTMTSFLSTHARDIRFLVTGALLTLVVLMVGQYITNSAQRLDRNAIVANTNNLRLETTQSTIPIPMDAFPEPAWRTPQTLGVRTVTSTPFARFEIHQVRKNIWL